MLKMKDLFDNRDLANMLLANWDFDKRSFSIMDNYRISSNAVYPFINEESLNFLRFAPTEEKSLNDVRAELEFIAHLRNSNFDVVQTVLSKKGNELIVANTPWGEYTVTAFQSVNGKPLSEFSYSHELYFGYGQSLGQLHLASRQYQVGAYVRPTWDTRLDWCREVLGNCEVAEAVKLELGEVRSYFQALPCTPDSFGLIHYDYELDNVFFDENTNKFTAIDYDDSLYHWYVMDIVKSVDNIYTELSKSNGQHAMQSFIEGYGSVITINRQLLENAYWFRRYANLFTYARIKRSISERWENEPDWLITLRGKLDNYLNELEYLLSHPDLIGGAKFD